MRELSLNEILSISGGTLTFAEFAAQSTSVPAEYMQQAYSSYLASQPKPAELAASASASANYNWGGPGSAAWGITYQAAYWTSP